MNKFQNILSILIVACFLFAGSLTAQDAPPMPRTKSQLNSKRNSALAMRTKKQEKSDQEQDKKDKRENHEESDDDKKSDDRKDNDEKDNDEKDDDEKDDDEKDDDEKDNDEKDNDEKDNDEKNTDKKDTDKKGKRNPRLSGIWGNSRTSTHSKKSDEFVDVFESVVASANDSTLLIMSGKRQIALGTVVDADGLVLTKASELRGELGCKLPNGEVVGAEVLGVDPETDLALLKLDIKDLSVIQWADESAPLTGRWVATPKAEKKGEFPTIGVVSVDAREIPASRPFIGIFMDPVDGEDGIRITRIVNKSPADLADLRVNDVILKIDDEVARSPLFLSETLGQYDISDRVLLTVRRGGKELKIKLTLAERDKISPDNTRSNTQNSMGSVLSRRRKDFPSSFQHDSMLSSSTCGGPIVDLSGKAVGINIARAGRVSSLALTAKVVLPILEKLKTGDYSPAVVNKQEIEERTADLEELITKIGDLPDKKRVLERKYSVERARKEEIERMIEELEDRLKDVAERTSKEKKELDTVRQTLRVLGKNQDNLEKELRELRTGSRF